ncbi:MAG: tRNA (N(6)-L-threonylcarbamoyladenosine(37)-C(2))-methylthiotransferase MtaB [Brevinemataceae bacterium]
MNNIQNANSQKIHIINLGCKLNAFEGEAVAQKLKEAGHQICADQEDADIVVVNTCTVTSKADEKGRKYMKRAKNQGKKVIATGCYATTDGLELAEENYIDLILRNEQKFNIVEYLSLLELDQKLVEGVQDTEFPEVSGFERTRAFLKVQDGCDKFCSFCKIPFARGRSRSKSPQKIQEVFQKLLQAGYKEIVLTGINLSDYQSTEGYLGSLVRRLLQTEGDFRIRLSSLQPDELDPVLLESLTHPKMCPHFHLSVQSGSDSVLQRMHRRYTVHEFLSLIKRIRDIRPDTSITTDIIVGFPEETELEFQDTLDLVRNAEFSRVHIFPYSRREGTTAARFNDISAQIKKEREKRLFEQCSETALSFAKKYCLNNSYLALTESAKNNIREAYTENYIRVRFPAENWESNEFVSVVPSNAVIDQDGHLVFLLS